MVETVEIQYILSMVETVEIEYTNYGRNCIVA